MGFWLSVGSAILFGVAGLLMKVSQMQKGSNPHLLLGLFVSGSLCFGIHTFLSGGLDWTSGKLWLWGAVVGIGAAWGNLVFMKALDYGPASLSSPLVNMNIVLIVAMSAWMYGESVSLAEATGIAMLLAAVVLISLRKERWTLYEKIWFALIGLAIILFTLRNGGLKVTSAQGLDNTQVLFIAYVLSALWFACAVWFPSRAATGASGRGSAPLGGAARLALRWGLACGVFSYAGLQLYAYALEYGKASIAAPIFATNSLVVAFGAMALYRERLRPLQGAALVLLMAGLVVLKL